MSMQKPLRILIDKYTVKKNKNAIDELCLGLEYQYIAILATEAGLNITARWYGQITSLTVL
jgi:hypothetical protein